MKDRMKVAIVRGASLCKWEMQTYEPLVERVDLLGVGSRGSDYDLHSIEFPVKRLDCIGEYLNFIPGGIAFLYRYLGDTQYLIGIDSLIEGYDIVNTAEIRSYYSLQAVRAKRKQLVKKIILRAYENIPFLGDEIPARRRIKQEVIDGVDHFMAATEGAKKTLLVEGVKEDKVSIVTQAFDVSRFSSRESKMTNKKFQRIREKYKLMKDDFVVLTVARMVKEKGWYDLLRVVEKIKESHVLKRESRKVRFLFVGDGPERRGLEEEARRLGIRELIVFTGWVGYGQKEEHYPELFQVSDLFIIGSYPIVGWKEQFGNVLVEAMASGLPIVATRCGSFPEVLGEGGTIFVSPHNVKEMTGAISKLLKHDRLRRDFGKLNRERAVEKYNSESVSERIYSIWKRVINE